MSAAGIKCQLWRSLAATVGVLCAWAVSGTAQNRGEDPETVFRRGMTALHNFEYEDANEAFALVRQRDPSFALAYWGEAMTYHQTLWRRENPDAARQVLARLGPTPEARLAKANTARDRGLLGAIDVLFGAGDPAARRQNYAAAMGRLYKTFPDDDDIGALYGLALMGTASRGLIGASEGPEGFGRALAGSAIQKEAAEIFTGVLSRDSHHAGALHYLLHDYDDPDHARLAFDAARTYARVANGASHALHMPAHIFLQLGLWHDASDSDRAAFDASTAWVARKQLPQTLRNYHALSWLQYELLQLGRFKDAQASIGEIEPVVRAGAAAQAGHDGTHQPLTSDLASMRARYAIETRQWNLMASATQFGNVNDLFAIGISAARTGNIRAAQLAQQTLAQRADAPEEGDLRPAIRIMEREMAALLELAGGRTANAIEILETATRAELALPAPLGLPAPIKPAPELLGEVLLDAGRPVEAGPHFESALKLHANRSLSVLGRARAAARSGDTATARQRYQELLANYDHADPDIPEVAEARAAISPAAAPAPARNFSPWIAGGVVVSALAIWWGTKRPKGSRRSSGSRKVATKSRRRKEN